jgi:transposase
MADFPFWLDDRQWSAIAAHLPSNQPGPRRVSDRAVISGIVFVLTSKIPWRDCPAQYGPYMTVFNRFNRWKRRSIWPLIVAELAKHGIDLSADRRARRQYADNRVGVNAAIQPIQGSRPATQSAQTPPDAVPALPASFRLSQSALADLKRLVADRGRLSPDQLFFSLLSWHHTTISATGAGRRRTRERQGIEPPVDNTSETRDLMVYCVSTMIDLNLKLIAALQSADSNFDAASETARKSVLAQPRG